MKLFYREYGKGKPVIIAHGLFGMSDNWIRIGKLLSENFKVYVLDMRNHGQSPHSIVHDYDAMSKDLLEFVDDLDINKAVFIGHSMGGKAVMQFASDFPERIEKMVTVDISPKAYLDDEEFLDKTINHKKILYLIKDLNLSSMYTRKEILKNFGKHEYLNDSFIIQLIQKNIKRNKDRTHSWKINIDALISNFDKLKKEISLSDTIKNIETLFIFGGKSPYCRKEDIHFIIGKFKNVTIRTIEGAGHLVHIEKEDDFISLVKDFL